MTLLSGARCTAAAALSCLVLAAAAPADERSPPQAAVPVEPVEAIVEAFATHDIVALSMIGPYEEHQAFRASLIRDPRFAEQVSVIVVYFGNARHQAVADRFVRGDEVPYDELQRVWQDTTQPHHTFDPPVYEALFRVVRAANASLPDDERLRVVLSDPPIDWATVDEFDDLLPWLQRRFDHAAEVVEREVLNREGKALLLTDTGILLRESPLIRAIEASGRPLFSVVWSAADVESVEPEARSWPRPSLAPVHGTRIGAMEIGDFAPGAPPGALQDHFDALLHLGPTSDLTLSRIAPTLCADEVYLDRRLPRLQLAARAGATGWLEDFTAQCADADE